jgi:CMP-N-acetylneuraminic acid synthetase
VGDSSSGVPQRNDGSDDHIPPKELFGHIVTPGTDFSKCPTEYKVYNCEGFGFHYVNRANKGHLNSSDTRTEDVIEDVLNQFPDEPSFCLFQPTSPIRVPKTLVHAKQLFEDGNMSALISVNPSYEPNGNFYFVRTKDFLEQKNVFVRDSGYYVCDGPMNIDVDYIYDFRIAQAALKGHVLRKVTE